MNGVEAPKRRQPFETSMHIGEDTTFTSSGSCSDSLASGEKIRTSKASLGQDAHVHAHSSIFDAVKEDLGNSNSLAKNLGALIHRSSVASIPGMHTKVGALKLFNGNFSLNFR